MSRGPVKIHRYDSSWSIQFEQYRDQLRDQLGDTIARIEHVGSTAVEGLGAKPIIDIIVTVTDVDVTDDLIDQISELGYEYNDKYEDEFPFRRYFVLYEEEKHKVHLHVVPEDHQFVRDHIVFRDYLRKHENVRDEYHLLKTRFANKYKGDRDAYQQAKGKFIEDMTTLAHEYFEEYT